MFLECNVKANPWIQVRPLPPSRDHTHGSGHCLFSFANCQDVVWTFEGNALKSNLSDGLLIANQSLVLQKVKRHHRGVYRCVATNTVGENKSNPFFLRVKCKSHLQSPGVTMSIYFLPSLNRVRCRWLTYFYHFAHSLPFSFCSRSKLQSNAKVCVRRRACGASAHHVRSGCRPARCALPLVHEQFVDANARHSQLHVECVALRRELFAEESLRLWHYQLRGGK